MVIADTLDKFDPKQLLSDFIVFSKYSRWFPEIGRRETWEELCIRNAEMHAKRYPHISDKIYQVYARSVLPKKVVPSMRSFQFAGKAIEKNPSRMFNCCAIAIDTSVAFSEIMFLLLGGSGVGFSVQDHHVAKLPNITTPIQRHRKFIVQDSIIGWADSIKALVRSYFEDRAYLDYDFSEIRPAGTPLKTAGGKAPGPQPLIDCIHNIRKVFDYAIQTRGEGVKLTPLECHDIICYIAECVISGGIRRSSGISMFSKTNEEMIKCKSPILVEQIGDIRYTDGGYLVTVKYKGSIYHDKFLSQDQYDHYIETSEIPFYYLESQRYMANNSVILLRSSTTEEEFRSLMRLVELSNAGEPGVLWTNDLEMLTNPCCLTGDMNLLTPDGEFTFKDLSEKCTVTSPTVMLTNSIGEPTEGKVWKTGVKDVYEIELYLSGISKTVTIKGTLDHVFMKHDGSSIKLEDISDGIILRANYTENDMVITNASFISKKFVGQEEVYDFSLFDDTHWGIVNGIVTHNCEIAIPSMAMCNLTEINVSNIESWEDIVQRVEDAVFLGTLQAGYTDFHYLRDEWRQNVENDALLGVSMTGIASNEIFKYDIKALSEIAKLENEITAKQIGVNVAKRIGTTKPSGTASLVFGTSSGIHAWHNDHYMRRVRVNKNEAVHDYLVDTLGEKFMEHDQCNPYNSVFVVPIKADEGASIRTESPFDLLKRVEVISKDWIRGSHREGSNTHNVSVTVSVKPDEWGSITDWMWNNRHNYNGISLLDYDGGVYIQPPLTDCTKEEYESMKEELFNLVKEKGFDLSKVIESTDVTDLKKEAACAGGASCEIH